MTTRQTIIVTALLMAGVLLPQIYKAITHQYEAFVFVLQALLILGAVGYRIFLLKRSGQTEQLRWTALMFAVFIITAVGLYLVFKP